MHDLFFACLMIFVATVGLIGSGLIALSYFDLAPPITFVEAYKKKKGVNASKYYDQE